MYDDPLLLLTQQLQQLQLDQTAKAVGPQLVQAARTGRDLLECFMVPEQQEEEQSADPTLQQQLQHEQQQREAQARHQLVQLLKDVDIIDDGTRQRNLLHLVATHSL